MKLPKTFSENKFLNVIIETPKGSRNKYAYQAENGLFELSKVLPAGTSFPYDFGFVPGTLADDGDPLDAMVIVETECFPGSLLECRPIGVIKAEQKEHNKKKERNDRIIAVAIASIDHSELKHVKDMNKNLLDELIHFFEYYNSLRNKKFMFLGIGGHKEAHKIIELNRTRNK